MNNTLSNLDAQPISRLQYATILVCFIMNILDGADVLIISYSAPAIAESWKVSSETLGIVFSAGLAGMTMGALLLAPLADHIGRKKMILFSALLMGSSVFLTSYSTTVFELIALRFVSGIGIGSMLASTAALTAEYTPDRSKDFWISLVIAGYPVGAVLSGLVAAEVIPTTGWPRMYQIAGLASFLTLPLIWFLLSESLEFYYKKQPKDALSRVNRILKKMQQPIMSSLPPVSPKRAVIPLSDLLSLAYRLPTLQLWLALFLSFGSLYFLTSWIPKLATDAGLSMSLAIYAGTVFNVGAFIGILTQGYFSSRLGLKRTIGAFFMATALLMAFFKLFIGSDILLLVFGMLGFGIQGGFVGLYAVAARMYPTEFRTTGVGWAIGAGRLGAVVSPAVGGVLIGMGLAMATNFMIFALPAMLAGIVTMRLSSKEIS